MDYNENVLVFGCSFSAGSYTYDPNYIMYSDVLQPDGTTKKVDNGLGRETLDVNGGWVESLDPKNYHTLYAVSGGGIVQHATVLEHYYNKNRLKDFDYVLVQLTYEPRLTWNEPGHIGDRFWHEYEVQAENVDLYQGKGTAKYFNFISANGKGDFGGNINEAIEWRKMMFHGMTNKHVIQSCATLIDERCRETETPLYYFKWVEEAEEVTPQFEHGICLDVPYPWGVGRGSMNMFLNKKYHIFAPIDPKISRDGKDTFIGHFNKAGNKKVGKAVRKALEKLR
tara:strand:+ start:18887 stop:19732 length:846 start_codon:yes stop_codon:yes gene_type:complete